MLGIAVSHADIAVAPYAGVVDLDAVKSKLALYRMQS